MRPASDLSAAGLVEIGAEDHGIDVATEHLQDMEINGRIHIQVGSVTKDGILPFGAVERGAELVEEGLEILFLRTPLGQANGLLPRFHIDHAAITVGKNAAFARAKPVELQQVTARDIWGLEVFRPEAIDIDAMLRDFDSFGEDVKPLIVEALHGTGTSDEISFNKACAGRITSDGTTQLIDEWVVDHGQVIAIRRIEHPISICRKTERGEIPFVVKLIEELQREGGLGKSGRSRTADVKAATRDKSWPVRQ